MLSKLHLLSERCLELTSANWLALAYVLKTRRHSSRLMATPCHVVYDLVRDNSPRFTPRLALYLELADFHGKRDWKQQSKWTMIDQNRQARQLLAKLKKLDEQQGRGLTIAIYEAMLTVCTSIDWTTVRLPARQGDAERLLRAISYELLQ